MQLSEEEILKNSHIQTSIIEKDIQDTLKEIRDLEDENEILFRDRTKNRVRIYLNEGGISQRSGFINELQQILDYRRKKEEQCSIS